MGCDGIDTYRLQIMHLGASMARHSACAWDWEEGKRRAHFLSFERVLTLHVSSFWARMMKFTNTHKSKDIDGGVGS